MKYKQIFPIVFSILCISLFSCKKDIDPNVQSFKIVKETEKITVTTNSATITGSYEYPGTVKSITVRVSESDQLFGSNTFVCEISEQKTYSVNITGLQMGTKYYYRYEADFGASTDFLSEIYSFTTLSNLPIVRTISWQELDSTTFRIKCEVVSDGGQAVTERGICYNTYGEPIINDDATLQHNTGGLGQYTIMMENLDLGKRYYVRSYAKNASGVGYGEELAFDTPVLPGMPVTITLSCNPIDGGTVSGEGVVPSGSQCTVYAQPNPTYTFVNWTENHVQVSSDAEYTFNVTVGRNLVANFTQHDYVIYTQIDPEDGGYVTGAGGFDYGDQCTLKATAQSGYTFINWTKNGAQVSTNEEYSFVVMESATYVAHFQGGAYSIGVSSNPEEGGTVSGGGSYNQGQTCTVVATANNGYVFNHWTENGSMASNEASYSFTVTSNRNLVANFSVQPQGDLPTLTTNAVTNITSSSATTGGNVTDNGGTEVTERGICWGFDENPDITGNHISKGMGTGIFIVNLTDLVPASNYHVRAYATNSAGTSYGDDMPFSTPANMPTVTIGEVTDITRTTAICSGNVSDNGGFPVTERGICWSTSPNPTIIDNHANSGTGNGSFSVQLTELTPGTIYYVRAYATNSSGTGYGSEIQFSTLPIDIIGTWTCVDTSKATTSYQLTFYEDGTVTGGDSASSKTYSVNGSLVSITFSGGNNNTSWGDNWSLEVDNVENPMEMTGTHHTWVTNMIGGSEHTYQCVMTRNTSK